jgi:hypothetical protein
MRVNVGQLVAQMGGMAVVFAVTLFLPAGTLAWPAGWAFFVLFFGFSVALSLWLLQRRTCRRTRACGAPQRGAGLARLRCLSAR